MNLNGENIVSQGKVTGIIYPPPDIRAIIDKTAQFVARNGRNFESKIAGESNQSKFSFLKPHDPYHAYYEHKVNENIEKEYYKETEENNNNNSSSNMNTNVEQKKMDEINTATSTLEKKPILAPVCLSNLNIIDESNNKKEENGIIELSPPDPEEFTIHHPSKLTSMDSDIISLTAQYTALNGKVFLANLATRESKNPQFDFLKPTNALFAYFTTLVESYAKLILQNQQKYKIFNNTNYYHQINGNDKNTNKNHSEYNIGDKEFNENKDENDLNYEQKELKILGRLIDGTKRMNVLDRCVYKLDYIKKQEEMKLNNMKYNDEERIAFQQIDWHDFVVVETITFDDEEKDNNNNNNNFEGKTFDMNVETGDNNGTMDNMEEDMSEEEDENEERQKIKVVEDYNMISNVKSNLNEENNAGIKLMTKEGIAVDSDNINEHMRILLMDKKWKQENERKIKKKTINNESLASDMSIADSLKRFAEKRTDIFTTNKKTNDKNDKKKNTSILNDERQRENNERKKTDSVVQSQNNENEQCVHHPLSTNIMQNNVTNADMVTSSTLRMGHSNMTSVPAPPPPPPSNNVHAPIISSIPPPPTTIQASMNVPPPPPPNFAPPPPPHHLFGLMGMPGMIPPPILQPGLSHPTSDTSDQPQQKKQKVGLLSEGEFIKQNPENINIHVALPNDPDNTYGWKLDGSLLSLNSISIEKTIKDLKQIIEEKINMPFNKQQIKIPMIGFAKDNLTLAHYNINDNTTLELMTRQRGGRR